MVADKTALSEKKYNKYSFSAWPQYMLLAQVVGEVGRVQRNNLYVK